jgi:hypothetical protein
MVDGSPASIGRAGAGTAADDGGAALLDDPAAMARRDSLRMQVGVSLADHPIDWQADTSGAAQFHDQAASTPMPELAIEGGWSGWVFGAAAMTSSAVQRTFASPNDFPVESPDTEASQRFAYRYAGIAGMLRRDTLTVGVARRIGDWLAIGASGAVSRVELDEQRSVWADPVQGATVDRSHDLVLDLDGAGYTPSAVGGVLIAPPDTRLELAASVGWTKATRVTGGIGVTQANTTSGASTLEPVLLSPNAELIVHQPVVVRAAARWVGQRWIGELDGDAWLYSSRAEDPVWSLGGVYVVDTASGSTTEVVKLPSRESQQSFGAVRAAVDVELIAGFLWATAGAAYTSAATGADRMSPTLGELAGVTGALGLEISSGGFTISLGASRTWAIGRDSPETLWHVDNPYLAGDPPAASGSYGGATNIVGVAVDTEL